MMSELTLEQLVSRVLPPSFFDVLSRFNVFGKSMQFFANMKQKRAYSYTVTRPFLGALISCHELSA